ncbi:TRL domain-containing protein [Sulfurimonas sp.]|uniref:TRL domain-containing protein n=1 Tax=Sulfurimonas sp. TaxID=2022749 RepID=UPI0025E2B272|nr:TRL domain-containing protein [Sulfurimonas sp.]MDD5157630.1 TRL domain-containing protein [Sulfurimonas sp.]
MLKKSLLIVTVASILFFSGCSNRIANTPAVMSYDGSSVDYSKIDQMKVSKVCKYVTDASGDTTIVAAAKAAGISKIKHVDNSYEYSTFLFWSSGHKNCVTVYGE